MANPYHFAVQFLNFLNYKIFNKGEQVFCISPSDYNISKLKTYIVMGNDFIEDTEQKEYVPISYQQAMDKGVIVMSIPAGNLAWQKNQRKIYYLSIKKRDANYVTRFALKGYIFEHDPYNHKIRLRGDSAGTKEGQYGPGGITPWFHYGESKSAPQFAVYDTYSEAGDSVLDKLAGKQSSDVLIKEIDEIPVMITEENELLCIKRAKHPQKILIVGVTGKGKSFLTNSISGRVFYMWEDRVGWANDSNDQFTSLMLPMDNMGLVRILKRIGNTPKPLPVVILYMSAPTVNMPEGKKAVTCLRLVLNFKEFLRKYKYYTYGVKKLELGAPEKYMNQFIDELVKCKSGEDVRNVLISNMIHDKKKDKNLFAMIYKWEATFNDIFKECITSNLFEDDKTATTELKLIRANEELVGHPFIICMEAGLMPVINTTEAKNHLLMRNTMADLINKIMMWQKRRGDKKKKIWIVMDEMNDFYEIGKRKDNLSAEIESLFRQGRILDVGFIGNTQSFLKVHDDVKSNLSHLFCMRIQTDKERGEIAKNFGLDNEAKDRLGDLKELEMAAMSKESWILYDKDLRRREVTGRMFVGKIIPPVSFHKS